MLAYATTTMAVVQCSTCGGRGVGLVEPPDTQPASTYGSAAQNRALWTRYHLPQLTGDAAWTTVAGMPRESRVLPLPTGLDAATCVQLAREHGFVAEPVERAACACAATGGMWTWLRGCRCPGETWIEYRKSPVHT